MDIPPPPDFTFDFPAPEPIQIPEFKGPNLPNIPLTDIVQLGPGLGALGVLGGLAAGLGTGLYQAFTGIGTPADEYPPIPLDLYGFPAPVTITVPPPDVQLPYFQDPFLTPTPMEPPDYFVPEPPVFTPIDPDTVPTGVPLPPMEPLPQLEPPPRPIFIGPSPSITDPRVGSPFGFPVPGRSPRAPPSPGFLPVPLAPPLVSPQPQPIGAPQPSPTGSPPERTTTPKQPPAFEPPVAPQPPRIVPQSYPLTGAGSQTVPFRKTKPQPAPAPTTPAENTTDEECKCKQKEDSKKKRQCGEGYFRTKDNGDTSYTYWTKRCGSKAREAHHGKRKYHVSHSRNPKHSGGGFNQQPPGGFGF